MWGMANYLPPELPSEDEASLAQHREWLQREYRKSGPDLHLVKLKMDLTFPSRRKAVVAEGADVKTVLTTYPWLQSTQQLLQEFERLGPNTSSKCLDDLMHSGLGKYHEAINKLTRSRKLTEVHKKLMLQVSEQRIDAQRQYTSKCAAVLGVSVLLKEKAEALLHFGEMTITGTPEKAIVIMVKDGILTMDNDAFELYVDGVKIFNSDSFLDCVVGLTATLYCFNLAYPKTWEKTLTFIQTVFLELKDDTRLDKRLMSVLTDINRELKK